MEADIPNVARMYDYFLGGYHNFAADREAAEQVIAVFPDTPAAARTNRRFLQHAVRYMAKEAGITQFLDVGAGLPTQGSVHETTGGRVVYVDNDPVAVAQSQGLVRDLDHVAVVHADLREPGALLEAAAAHLDMSEPVGLLLVSILHFVPDEADPGALVARLRDATAAGSHVAVSHLTLDGVPAAPVEQGRDVYRRASAPIVPRTRMEILRLLEGWELVEPGLVKLHEWRPDDAAETVSHGYGAVGRKP
jgi:O-methyltransferase involved in polyketide biosynthesis